jgi:small GTP-binding protein
MQNGIKKDGIPPGLTLRHTFRGHGLVKRVAWSPDGRKLASSSTDQIIRIWDVAADRLCQSLRGHSGTIYGVAWSPNGLRLASGAKDSTVRVWDAEVGKLQDTLEGHFAWVMSTSWSPDGRLLASGSDDSTIRLWDTETGLSVQTLQHPGLIQNVAWSPGGQILASASTDSVVRLWNANTWDVDWVLQGHRGPVFSVAWSPDGQILASGSEDMTIRLWDKTGGYQISTLEGHTSAITCVSFSYDGRFLASKSRDDTVRLWRCDTWETVAVLREPHSDNVTSSLAFHPKAPTLATLGEGDTVIRIWDLDSPILLGAVPTPPTVHYLNAKVVLVGESGVGKSGLGIRIAEKKFRTTESTHGAQFWQIQVPEHIVDLGGIGDVHAELTLWDLAGQPEYRLVHQLFLDDVNVALLLFDCSDPADPFRGAPYWVNVLKKHAPSRAIKFLVSARCDVSPVTVDQREINRFLVHHELDGYIRTSAKTGEGVDALVNQVLKSIPWNELPHTVTPRLFQSVREFLLERKAAGDTLIPMNEIRRSIHQRYTQQGATQEEIDTVIDLLQAQGLVNRLDLTNQLTLMLLRPELINQYASSIIQTARDHPRDIGAIPERDALTANLPLVGFKRLEPGGERIVLESTVELLIRHDLCFREMGLLVFPSQINTTRPPRADKHPSSEVTYQFSGSLEAIYASLVVRLSNTDYFKRESQWRYAVEFSRDSHRLGFAMRQVKEGTGELEIYFYPGVSELDRITFIRFITDHLHAKGVDIQEHIRLYCHRCGKEVVNQEAIEARVQAGKLDIPCQFCGGTVLIPRSIEECYRSDRSYVQMQKKLAKTAKKRTEQEVKAFKKDWRRYTREEDNLVHILHLSDIHLGTKSDAGKYRTQLQIDLIKELKVSRLEYLVISGDVANCSTPDEYEAAFELIDGLVKYFGLDASRVVIVPGNHDLNWNLSKKAYPFVFKDDLPDPLPEGQYISAGDAGALIRDEGLYQQRFANFNTHFFKKVFSGQEYPLDYAKQGILVLRPDDRLLFLALNSAWEIDHHYQKRASINMDALSCALDQLADSKYDDWLKIAVWHHPVTGKGMTNDEFMQLLAVYGFQVCMHGHIHEAIEGFYKYDPTRSIHIVSAGTFGAPLRKQAGIPLQYNLLTLDPETRTMMVETRKKEKPDGAWSADARWGAKNEPKPWYTIELR